MGMEPGPVRWADRFTSIHDFGSLCDSIYEMSPRKKVNVYFLDFLFVQTLYLNSSLSNGRHLTVCIQYL